MLNVTNVTELYDSGKSQTQIGEYFGVSQWKISKFMRDNNIKRRDKLESARKVWTKSLNHNILDNMSEETCWFMGWMLSDGHIEKNGRRISFCISDKDIDVLETISRLISYEGDISIGKSTLNGKEFGRCQLNFTSKPICNKLAEFNIVNNKTLNETFPAKILDLDVKCKQGFVRGVFEGDGSIFKSSAKNSITFQIVGTYELLDGIQSLLVDELGVSKTKITRNGNSDANHYSLRYNGVKYPKLIMDWIYNDPKINMMRKYNKYKELI